MLHVLVLKIIAWSWRQKTTVISSVQHHVNHERSLFSRAIVFVDAVVIIVWPSGVKTTQLQAECTLTALHLDSTAACTLTALHPDSAAP